MNIETGEIFAVKKILLEPSISELDDEKKYEEKTKVKKNLLLNFFFNLK